MTTGTDLKEARENAGLTQEQVAEKLGLHRATIVTWESRATVKRYKAELFLRAVSDLTKPAAA